MLVVPVFVVLTFQSKPGYEKLSILNKTIWIYISPLRVIVITHHYCADRLNTDRFGAGSFSKQAPLFVVSVANPDLYK